MRHRSHPVPDASPTMPEGRGMWPLGTQLDWTIMTLVIALLLQVVVQRCRRADVDLVLRNDGAVWPPLALTWWRADRTNSYRRLVCAEYLRDTSLTGTGAPRNPAFWSGDCPNRGRGWRASALATGRGARLRTASFASRSKCDQCQARPRLLGRGRAERLSPLGLARQAASDLRRAATHHDT